MKARISVRSGFCISFALFAVGCSPEGPRQLCDMTPDGSVWLTVARLSWAEEKFHRLHGRYGELADMTNLFDGLPPEVTAGRMGSYTITIKLTDNGYVLRANPEVRRRGRVLSAFYGDQTGIVTYNRSGQPAGPDDEAMNSSSSLARKRP